MTPRNPETDYYEIRKAQRDQKGERQAIEVVARVQGNARAQHLVEVYNRNRTEEDQRNGFTYYWEYTPRRMASPPRRIRFGRAAGKSRQRKG